MPTFVEARSGMCGGLATGGSATATGRWLVRGGEGMPK